MFNLENYYDFYETCIRAQTLLQSKLGEGGDGTPVSAGSAAPIATLKEEMAGIPNARR